MQSQPVLKWGGERRSSFFSVLGLGSGWGRAIWQPKPEPHSPPSFPCPSQASEAFLPQALTLWKNSCLSFPPSCPFLAVLETWPQVRLSDPP